MRAVDTNVLVRLATRDDAKQVAAAEAFIAKGAWVPHLVLAETIRRLRECPNVPVVRFSRRQPENGWVRAAPRRPDERGCGVDDQK